MDEQKYGIRKVVGSPGASILIVREKMKNSTFIAWFSALAAIALILTIVISFVLEGDDKNKLTGALISGLMWGGVYGVIGLGMVVVYKSTRIFNMAHGGVALILAYLAWWLLAPDRQDLPWPLVLFVILPISAAIIGLVIDRFIFGGMIGAPPLITFMMTLILGGSMLPGITILAFEGKSQIMPQVFPTGTIEVGNYHLSWALLASFITATLMFLIFVMYFRFTKSGLAMRCVSEDSVVSQSLGINVKMIYSIAWIVGCLSAAIGGFLLATQTAVYSESGGLGGYALIRALPIVILGGLESITGCYLAALMIGLAEQLAGAYIDPHIPQFRAIMPHIALLAIMIIRPHGLFGLKGIKRI